MKKNVSGLDHTARLAGGALLVLLGIAGYTGFVWVAVGPSPQALTAIVLVVMIGRNTRKAA